MLRLLALLAALSAAALAGLAGPSAAAAPCWKELINDWLDGRIDHVYPVRCYREALRHLPTDIEQYSSARDDINRALAARIAGGEGPTGPSGTAGGIGGTGTTPSTGAGGTPGTSGGAPSATSGGGSRKAGGTPSGQTSGGTPGQTSGKGGSKGAGRPASGGVAPGRDPGRGGPVGGVIREAGPDSVDAVPIPLLVLGSLAVLLVLLGSAGFLARRLQARRAVRPAAESRIPKP